MKNALKTILEFIIHAQYVIVDKDLLNKCEEWLVSFMKLEIRRVYFDRSCL